jgi:hypothetical protein
MTQVKKPVADSRWKTIEVKTILFMRDILIFLKD